jgi:hypothetical protein
MSLTLDIKIVFGTLPMLIFGEQATELPIIHMWRDMPPAAGLQAVWFDNKRSPTPPM